MLVALSIWLVVLGWGFTSVRAAPPILQPPDCHFFTETAEGEGGYSVCDDEMARFKSAFEQWGVQSLGYPISQRFEWNGFITQAFQKAVLQWRPDTQSVAVVNIFDEMHNAGLDNQLSANYQIPSQLPPGWDGEGVAFEEIVEKRLALLDERPLLREAYFSASDPLTFFGLPSSEVTDMGSHYAIRLQRAVLQEWKEDVPWAKAGDVTIANAGEIAGELRLLPAAALTPKADPASVSTPQPSRVQIGSSESSSWEAVTFEQPATDAVTGVEVASREEAEDIASVREVSAPNDEGSPTLSESLSLDSYLNQLVSACLNGAALSTGIFLVVGFVYLLRFLVQLFLQEV